MTNTKFRKRALLSSVAMLLVALVALGSATFAWFSTTNTADAKGLTAGTVKASNLLIKEDYGDDWAQSFTFKSTTTGEGGVTRYNNMSSVNPVTTDDLSSWYTVSAAEYNGGVAEDFATDKDTVTVPGQNVATATVYLISGNTGGDAKDIKLSISGLTGSVSTNALKYVRVAIKPITDSTNDVTTPLGTAKIFGQAKDDFAKQPTAFTSLTADATKSAVTNLFSEVTGNNSISLGTATAGTVYAFRVYVYYEGTDVDCIDTASGVSLSGIEFNFSAVDPTP